MLGKFRILSIVLTVVMAFTVTYQMPSFAYNTDDNLQPSVEQDNEEKSPDTGESVENQSVENQSEEPESGDDVFVMAQSAPESNVWDGKTVDISWYDPAKKEYDISTGAQLAGLAAIVNGWYDQNLVLYGDAKYIEHAEIPNFPLIGYAGGGTSGTVYKGLSENDFMGKTVHIRKDIDMSKGNYMPIGGKYTMQDKNGTQFVEGTETPDGETGNAHFIEAYFNGILDGHGHTITINCDRYTKSGFAYSMAAGLVGYLGDLNTNEGDRDYSEYGITTQTKMKDGWIPTVRNVTVKGKVHARRMVGGVVGRVGETTNGVIIENCANHANVSNTDAKGVGGIVGAGWGTGEITNCYNTGEIKTTYNTCPVGGICAENSGMNIYNCYNTGKIIGKYSRGIGGHESGTYTVANCYSLKGCDGDPASNGWYRGTASNISIDVQVKTADEMKGIADDLNSGGDFQNNYVCDIFESSAEYPVLYFEKSREKCDSKCTVSFDNSKIANGDINLKLNGKPVLSGTQVPYGSVIRLSETHDGGYILDYYTAKTNAYTGRLNGNMCTVTEDLEIGASIVKLLKGRIELADHGKVYTLSASKSGTDPEDYSNTRHLNLIDGDMIFQKDVIKVKAVLDRDAVPKDTGREYSGEFEYSYTYTDADGNPLVGVTQPEPNKTGRIVVDNKIGENVNNKLIITARPETRVKTWQSYGDTSWYYDGDDEYVIEDADDLAGLAYLVNIEGKTFRGETVSIPSGTTISLKDSDGTPGPTMWPGIGLSEDRCFQGTFNGNGSTITDMIAGDESSDFTGLFNYCNGATIRNLTVRGNVKSASGAGGIAGACNETEIINCINFAKIEGGAEAVAGGMAGQMRASSVSACINRGGITGGTGSGGIVGDAYIAQDDSVNNLTDCTNYAYVKSFGYDDAAGSQVGYIGRRGTGGIAGECYGNVSGCANYGDVYSLDKYTGGIAGYSSYGMENAAFVIKNSYNRGKVTAKSTQAGTAVGGIFGYAQKIDMNNVYNSGQVIKSDGEGVKAGGIVGEQFRSIQAKINNAYWLEGTCDTGINYSGAGTSDVIIVPCKTEAEMKANTFATLLKANDASSDYVAVPNGYPEFGRIGSNDSFEKMWTVTYVDYDDPTAEKGTVTVNNHGSVGLIQPEEAEWAKYEFYDENGNRWDGKDIISDTTVKVKTLDGKNAEIFNVTFVANGEEVEKVTFSKATAAAVEAPDMPVDAAGNIGGREGYVGTWPDFQLTGRDTTVRASYKQAADKVLKVKKVKEITESGYYNLGGSSTGTITIKSGVNATIDGSNGKCTDLNIVMEEGSTLNAKALNISCEKHSTLTMNKNCRLNLIGKNNRIEGACTEADNKVPAVIVKGDSVIGSDETGKGCLEITSETGNTSIYIDGSATLTLAAGNLNLYKESKIGFNGGMLYAPGGTFRITGGCFNGAADSDNLHTIKVKHFEMSGGDALISAHDAKEALVAETMDVTGGNMKVKSADYAQDEADKSEKNRTYYSGVDSIDCPAWTDTHTLYRENTSGLGKPYVVYVDGEVYYEGTGLTLDYEIDEYSFVKNRDKSLYIWLDKEAHEIITTKPGVDINDEEAMRGYDVNIGAASVDVVLTGTRSYSKSDYKAVATYDDQGNMLDFNYKRITDNSPIDINEPGSAALIKIFILEDINTLIPRMPSSSYEQ